MPVDPTLAADVEEIRSRYSNGEISYEHATTEMTYLFQAHSSNPQWLSATRAAYIIMSVAEQSESPFTP